MRLALIVLSLLCLLIGCGSDDTSPVGTNPPPPNHTVSQSGRLHAPGLCQPQQNCASCHGDDLRGGSNGEPSCFQCHGAEWNTCN